MLVLRGRDRELMEGIALEVFQFVFHRLDSEVGMDGETAGYIATACETTFVEQYTAQMGEDN